MHPGSIPGEASKDIKRRRGATMQVLSRLDYDSCKAERRIGDVVVFIRFQRPYRRFLLEKNGVGRREDLVEVVCADELL